MPTYTCTSRPGLLDDGRRAALASAITRAHAAATGAPTSFVQVVFQESAHRFIGGQASDAHVMVRGDIRSGRTSETRSALARTIAAEAAEIACVAAHEVWVYLAELAASDMIEFGHVLPAPGDESAWLAALPPELRDALAALGKAQSAA